MTETLRYTFGESSLGAFVAVASDRGVVAFEFNDRGSEIVDTLRDRFPDAALVEDRDGLSELARALTALVDQPESKPEIALDPRGSEYQIQVWSMLREIHSGLTTNYGSLAARLGSRDAREVTEAIASNAIAILIPCHRVIRKDGSLSGYRWGVRRKRALLERERQAAPFRLEAV